jgi:hypothetical protein
MVSLKQLAVESKENSIITIANISELDVVDVNIDVVNKTFGENTTNPFTLSGFFGNDGKFYKIPKTVLNQIGALLEETDFEKFKVIKSGTGMNTMYTVRIIE